MTIELACPSRGMRLKTPPTLAGKMMPWPGCKKLDTGPNPKGDDAAVGETVARHLGRWSCIGRIPPMIAAHWPAAPSFRALEWKCLPPALKG